MNRRLAHLARELGLSPTPPPFHLDTGAICRRVEGTLTQKTQERKAYMRHRLKIAAILVAAAVALTGTALAVATNLDVLRAFFDGDLSAAEGLVDREVRSVSDQNYTFTVESSVSDGKDAYLLVRVDALSPAGIAKLNSDDWNGIDLFSIYPLVEDKETGGLAHPSASGTSYGEVEEARTETSRTYAVNPSLPSDDSAVAVYARMGYMEKGLSIQVPLAPAKSVTVTVGAEGAGFPSLFNASGGPIKVTRITLSPFTLQIDYVNPQGKYLETPTIPLLLRRKDGTLLGLGQVLTDGGRSWGQVGKGADTYGSLSSRFRSVMDLEQISGVVLWGKEYPLDGGAPRVVEVDPHLLPFTLPLLAPLNKEVGYSIPVRALMEGLGGTCTWDNAAGTATLTYRDTTLVLTPGSTTALVNGQSTELDAAPRILDGALCASGAICGRWGLDYVASFNAEQTERICWVIIP